MNNYFLIFIGLIIGGESVLLPSIYLAGSGKLNATILIFLALTATLLSDTFWYMVGRRISTDNLIKLPILWKRKKIIEKLLSEFDDKYYIFIFLSKFTYGLRIILHMLSGAEKINFLKYFAVNLISISAWLGFLFSASHFIRYNNIFSHIKILGINISFTVLFILAIILLIWTRRKISKRWFQQ